MKKAQTKAFLYTQGKKKVQIYHSRVFDIVDLDAMRKEGKFLNVSGLLGRFNIL